MDDFCDVSKHILFNGRDVERFSTEFSVIGLNKRIGNIPFGVEYSSKGSSCLWISFGKEGISDVI